MVSNVQSSVWEGATRALPGIELALSKTAFLIIDMQYLDAHPDYGIGRRAQQTNSFHRFAEYFSTIREIIPRVQSLQRVCRGHEIEVMFAAIASNVKDCRDVSLLHKRVDLLAPSGSREAQILEEIAPRENELVLIKGSSGVFNGTAIDQILRNMGIDTLVIAGVATNYCVETAVRDAADRNYNVILLSDACASVTREDHQFALRILNDTYCKVMTTQEVIDMIMKAVEARSRTT